MSVFEIIGLAITGFFSGIFGTMIGIGGGIIFVPIFLLVFHFTPQEAAGTSLVAVFFNSLSGTISYLRQKRVDIKAGIKFMLATIPGAFLGTWILNYVASELFGIIFAALLMIMSITILLHRAPHEVGKIDSSLARYLTDASGHSFTYVPKEGWGVTLSFLVGIISSLLGIGGGIIQVPAMIYLLGFPVHIATATSNFVLAGSSFFGSLTHIYENNVLFVPALIVAATAVPGAMIGASISRHLKGGLIIRMLAIALASLGIRLLLKSLNIF